MTPTKYDFMRDMLIKYRNKHRKELGLCPEQPEAAQRTPEPIKATDGQAGGPDGKLANPMPIKTKVGLGVMCEYDDDAPEPEGTVFFNSWPKVGDEVVLPSDGKTWFITRIREHDSYPVIVRMKEMSSDT